MIAAARNVTFAYEVEVDPEEKNIKYESVLRLSCVAYGAPEPEYSWTKKGDSITATGSVYFENARGQKVDKPDAVLVNAKVTAEDTGNYEWYPLQFLFHT